MNTEMENPNPSSRSMMMGGVSGRVGKLSGN
jgi:hypothetical protein